MTQDKWDATIQTKTKSHYQSNTAASNGCLVRIHPMELENKLVRISQVKTSIGREPSNDILCDDTSISRNHACIHRTEFGFALEDCGSTNGTFVDGQSVSKCVLNDGCQVQVGNHIFKFLAGDSIESRYHETVYSMMTKDGLTNVYNKRYLLETLEREFDRGKANGRPFSFVMIDIDFFKKFNDTYGHLAGDEVLQEFAKRIQAQCGANQVFARFGGEEFAVLLVETAVDEAAIFAESIRKVVADELFECCAGPLKVTASFGVAEFKSDAHSDYSELLEESDQNLYAAKENGRNQVSCG